MATTLTVTIEDEVSKLGIARLGAPDSYYWGRPWSDDPETAYESHKTLGEASLHMVAAYDAESFKVLRELKLLRALYRAVRHLGDGEQLPVGVALATELLNAALEGRQESGHQLEVSEAQG